MQPKFWERHQDYVFSAPTLPSGYLAAALAFQLDPDAPFVLRSMAARVPYDASGRQTGLQFVSARFTGPRAQDYRADAPVPLPLMLGPYFGQVGNPRPVFPEIEYPPTGVIYIDLANTGANPVSGLQLFFRGVKRYPWNSRTNYTYPDRMSRDPLRFLYPLTVAALPVTAPGQPAIAFNPQNDSDFVLRFGQAGSPNFASPVNEVFITLMDEGMKPFSNAPVHVDVLFGRSLFPAAFPVGSTFVSPVGPGASQPGLFFKEIYVPRNHQLFYEVSRNDSGYGGAVAVNYPLTFGGEKVFPG